MQHEFAKYPFTFKNGYFYLTSLGQIQIGFKRIEEQHVSFFRFLRILEQYGGIILDIHWNLYVNKSWKMFQLIFFLFYVVIREGLKKVIFITLGLDPMEN